LIARVDFSGVLEDPSAFAVIKSSYTRHAALQQAGPRRVTGGSGIVQTGIKDLATLGSHQARAHH
jgi:hypothetical protein